MFKHPYERYVDTEAWKILKLAFDNLEKNKDIELHTREEYVIGYILKIIKDNKLVLIRESI